MNQAKEMVGRNYKVTKDIKIGNCKMKIGDLLTVTDWGAGMVSYVVSFTNNRLPHYKFQAGDWVIRQNAMEF